MKNIVTPTQLLPIYITRQDKYRLQQMLLTFEKEKNLTTELNAFAAELERATTVEPHNLPDDVVRMNSRITIMDLDTSEELTFTLVFPEDANPDENKLSILAPIASGALGYECGDEIEWDVPAGTRRFRITEVTYDPGES